MMPYKYVVEMICDTYAAGMNYQGKNWEKGFQLQYFKTREEKNIGNETLKSILLEVYTEVSEKGIDEVINKKRLKEIYNKHIKHVDNI